MRALTIDELEWVSGGTPDNGPIYNGPSAPNSPLGCLDTINGCGDSNSFSQFLSLGTDGESSGGVEDVYVFGKRPDGGYGFASGSNLEDLCTYALSGALEAANTIGTGYVIGSIGAAAGLAVGVATGGELVVGTTMVGWGAGVWTGRVVGAYVGHLAANAVQMYAC